MALNRDEILADPDFKKLIRSKWVLSIILCGIVSFLYYGFVLLMAYNKPLFAEKITGMIYIGIPIGVFVLASTIIFTALYVIWANKTYDNLVGKVKEKIRSDLE